jgi:hypothetical protein
MSLMPCQASTITDTSTIKDIFILRPPSNAPDDLTILYEFQLTNLNNLRRANSDVELGEGITPISITEIIRTTSSANEANLIATHLSPKYVVPPQLAAALKSGSSKNRGATKQVFHSRDDHPTNNRPTNNQSSPSVPPGTVLSLRLLTMLTCSDVLLGAFYDPRVLPDFGGPLFQLVHAKLVQRNLTDVSDKLIPPWETYAKLHPGTLVLMKVQLLTFDIEDMQRNGSRKVRRSAQRSQHPPNHSIRSTSSSWRESRSSQNLPRTWSLARSSKAPPPWHSD